MPYQEQASTRAKSRLIIFMKWDQKSSTINNFVHSIDDQITPIGYGS